MNAVILAKLPKIPLLANKKSQPAHGISSLSQVMGLAAYKLRPVIGSVHGLTLVPEYEYGRVGPCPPPSRRSKAEVKPQFFLFSLPATNLCKLIRYTTVLHGGRKISRNR